MSGPVVSLGGVAAVFSRRHAGDAYIYEKGYSAVLLDEMSVIATASDRSSHA